MRQGTPGHPEGGKAGRILPYRPEREGGGPARTLTYSLQKWERIDLCWFKPLSLWWFVMASPRKPACEIRLVFNQLEFRSSQSTLGLEDNIKGLSL